MRVSSQDQLNDMPMNPVHKAKIAALLQNQASNHARSRPCRNQPSNTSTTAATSGSQALHEALSCQRQLWRLMHADEVCSQLNWVSDFVGAVPNRKFEIDIACPDLLMGVETDGWSNHGQRKKDFLRDREKDYLMMLEGWLVLRIQAGLIYKDPGEALNRVKRFIETCAPRQKRLLKS